MSLDIGLNAVDFKEDVPETTVESTDGNIQLLQAENGVPIVVPGGAWLLDAEFSPQGSDLLLT
ncbi:MAG: hypothetical protein HN521_09285, partial [Candidatus Latescibacteria bacterium]|nr:hypothetical protein [Candidatus Latescibacterota bacterium]